MEYSSEQINSKIREIANAKDPQAKEELRLQLKQMQGTNALAKLKSDGTLTNIMGL